MKKSKSQQLLEVLTVQAVTAAMIMIIIITQVERREPEKNRDSQTNEK